MRRLPILLLPLCIACGSLKTVSPANPAMDANSSVGANVPAPIPTVALSPASVVCNGNLLWSDEFDGHALDMNKWNYEVNCDGGGNGEQECYVESRNNLALDGNGHMSITVLKQNYNGKPYTSARINSQGKAEFVFGCFESRLQVPKGQGVWPAFWMLSSNQPYGTWPTSGELDIMEILGQDTTRLYGTAHFGPAWPNQQQDGNQYVEADFSSDYHTFSLVKTPDHVTWYADGKPYFTLDANAPLNWGRTSWPFDANNPMNFIFNVAMGGQWPKTPDPNILSASMNVDYVRAYAPMAQ